MPTLPRGVCSAGVLCGVGRMFHIRNNLSITMFIMRSKFVKKNYPQLSGHKKAPRWRGWVTSEIEELRLICYFFNALFVENAAIASRASFEDIDKSLTLDIIYFGNLFII